MRPIETIILVIGGFRQDRNATAHGMSRLHERLAELYWDRRRSVVMLEHWSTRASTLGDKIAHAMMHRERVPPLHIVSYSWGNPTARSVLKRLEEYALSARSWMMIDPVVRWSQIWWSPRNLLALTTLGTFDRPENVERVTLFRQVNGSPTGRRVTGLEHGDRQVVFGARDLLQGESGILIARPDVDHNKIDDTSHVRNEVLRMIAETSPPPGQGET